MKTSREIAEIITADSDLSTDMVQSYIQDFAKQKCKEQREICANNKHEVSTVKIINGKYKVVDSETKITHESILNAPEPNFD